MSVQVTSQLNIQRDAANNQTIAVEYQFDRKALKPADGDKFLVLFGLRNVADDSFIKHLGEDEISLSSPWGADLKWKFSTILPDSILDVNKGANLLGKDTKSESVYVRVRVYNIDLDPSAVSKTNPVSGNFGPEAKGFGIGSFHIK